MRRIQSKINPNSDKFKQFYAHNVQVVAEFRARQEAARHERRQRDIDRLRRQEKLLVRERIALLLDPETPFLEISSLAANQAYGGEVPGAGVVIGVGVVNGREVLIHANDSSIKGGAWYPISVRKIIRGMEIAMQNHLPVVHIADSAGAFLPLQAELFPDVDGAGRIFRHQCKLSAMGIPQIAVVVGHCTAGGAYVPALSDYSIMVRGMGGIFLGGPPLVKAATGEDVSADELGGADVQAGISGTADYAVDSEEEAFALARDIVGSLQRPEKAAVDKRKPEAPFYDPVELYGIIPDDTKKQFDMREVIARIVDGSRFLEFKPDYGTTLICGYAYIWGYKVGIVANNGVLFNDSTHKGTQFMQLCDRDGVPLVFLQNITGFMVGKEYEQRGITKDGAKWLMVQANVRVPKFTIMVGGSFGAGNYAMAGRAYDARFLFTWPNSQISVMGGEQAAKTLLQIQLKSKERKGETLSQEEQDAFRAKIEAEYIQQGNAYFATSDLWDDGIIDPVDTRNALGMALSAALNAPLGPQHFGVMRT